MCVSRVRRFDAFLCAGQLGLGPGAPSVVPGPTLAPLWAAKGSARKAALGKNHTLLCYADGSVYSAGAGERGALGYGERKSDLPERQLTPRKVEGGELAGGAHIVHVAAGVDFSLAFQRPHCEF